jgi:hypothetical protein
MTTTQDQARVLITPINTYPEGAMVRISDICRDQKRGRSGLLPISRSTWNRWVEDGTAPKPKKLHGTPVWPIEQVRALAV